MPPTGSGRSRCGAHGRHGRTAKAHGTTLDPTAAACSSSSRPGTASAVTRARLRTSAARLRASRSIAPSSSCAATLLGGNGVARRQPAACGDHMSSGREPSAGEGKTRMRPVAAQANAPSRPDTHRWARATTRDDRWGPLCACGNLKTDQALTCTDCAVGRRRAPNYWERRTCACGAPKTKDASRCRRCANEGMRGVPRPGRPQPAEHPFRRAEAASFVRRAA